MLVGSNGYHFSWEMMRLFLEGFSPIDLSGLALTDRSEAAEFLSRYGYDVCQPSEAQVVEEVQAEAVAFIERFLCPSVRDGDFDLEIPTFAREGDVLDLLTWASSDGNPWRAAWSCALLRVMHTISHANRAVRVPHYDSVKDQVLGRFQSHIKERDGKLTLGSGPDAVPLEAVFFKEQKSRESLILKLLHKPRNVASEVYDRMGVKLVTPTKVEALLALKYLRKAHLVSVAQVTPGRSRNTLVDLDEFRSAYESLTRLALSPEDESQRDLEFVRQMQHRPQRETESVELRIENPFSATNFRSIQFTCRHLVKVPNPARAVLDELRVKVDEPELLARLESEHDPELMFYFPYEVQITDLENYLASLEGETSHSSYKRRQLQAARTRVLAAVLKLKRRQLRTLSADGVVAADGPSGRENCAASPD